MSSSQAKPTIAGERRPEPQPRRVAQRRLRRRRAASRRTSAAAGARARAPRAERAKTSPNSTLGDRHADPEDHVDERHREVRVRDLRAVEAAVEHEREQRDADDAGEDSSTGARRERCSRSPRRDARRSAMLLCSCGVRHSVESATNETTSTIAAVQLNSHTGIGRSALPTIPCASARGRQCERGERGAAEQRGQHATSRRVHAARSLCDAVRRGRRFARRSHACALRPRRAALAYPASCMIPLPLAVSTGIEAALQLGPLALLALLYARRVRTLATTRTPSRAGARPASTRAS